VLSLCRVPKGIKKAPALSPGASSRLLKSRETSPDTLTLSQSTDHTRATESLSKKKCRSLSKKDIRAGCPCWRLAISKLSQADLSSKNCSLNQDVECPSNADGRPHFRPRNKSAGPGTIRHFVMAIISAEVKVRHTPAAQCP